MNIFKLILKVNGFKIDRAQRSLTEIQNLKPENILLYQQKKAEEIFKFHFQNNENYKDFVGEYKGFEYLPILTKSSIQLPLEKRLTAGFNRSNAHVHNTSGSSGTPFFFAKDKDCHSLSWALILNRFLWHNVSIGRDLQARFYGIPLSSKKYLVEKVKDYFANRVRFPVFDLSDETLSRYLDVFRKKNFVYINGYTSSLVLFAKYLIKSNIILKDVTPSLIAVFTTSEVCDDIDRSIMEKGFGVKVVNEYGAAELDLIGFEDQNGNRLLNYETLYVEVLDDNNRPVGPGEEGRVIVTSLYNKAMPFIRYELGDRIILTNKWVNGYRVIEKVVGRVNDVAVLPSGKKSPGLTFYYISKALLESGGFMKEFIIKQTALDSFTFEYVAVREISQEEKEKVKEAMDLYLEPGLKATFVKREKLERTKAGKLKHFFSEI